MPYILKKTNGQQLAVIQDGSTNATTADLTFVGKNYSGYGQIVNENFLQLLENFASPVGPATPIVGELWWNTAYKKLNVNVDGTTNGWKKLALINNDSAGFPLDQTVGDFYWDKTQNQLWVYDGAEHKLVGPINSGSAAASGAISGTIDDTIPPAKTVVFLQVNGDNVAVVYNGTDFTPKSGSPFQDPLQFPKVGQGITLKGVQTTNATSQGVPLWQSATNGHYLWGTAQSAVGLVREGDGRTHVYGADDFLLKSELASFSGAVNVKSDAGIKIGAQQILQLWVSYPGIEMGSLSNIGYPKISFDVRRQNSTSTSQVFVIDGSVDGFNAILPATSGANPPGFTDVFPTNIGATNSPFLTTYSTNTVVATITAPGLTPPSTPAPGNGTITGNWTVVGNLQVTGGSINATTSTYSTNANVLLGSDLATYQPAKSDGTANAIVQYSGTGGITASSLTAKTGGSGTVNGTWVIGTNAHLQATTLLGDGSTGYVGANVDGSVYNTIVQRDGSGGITGSKLYGASVQAIALNAGADYRASGTINGQWSIGSQSSLQATSLQGTGGYFAATTANQANSIVQRDTNGDIFGATLHGTATTAQYADLAENYTSDQEYEPGTVLVIGGDAETTQCTIRASINIAGIVSTNPAHLMNSTIDGVAVALSGRVPCKVVGPINKGDLLVTSQTPGYAEVYQDGDSTLAVIGRALQDAPDGLGLIEVKV